MKTKSPELSLIIYLLAKEKRPDQSSNSAALLSRTSYLFVSIYSVGCEAVWDGLFYDSTAFSWP